MVSVFANGPGDLGSIPARVIPKTQNDASLLNTQHYKVWIKSKVEQSKEKELHSPLNFSVVGIENGDLMSSSTKIANFT